MKILHINTSDSAGGAAIAARRIIRAERRYGLDASMLTRGEADPKHGRWNFLIERLGVWFYEGLRRKHLWEIDPGTHGVDITRLPEFQAADIVHLHWVNQGMLSIEDIARIRQTGKPLVWTMHDMWAFTSVCHHADECKGFMGDGRCKGCRFNSSLAESTYRRKEKAYSGKGSSISFVACSHWLEESARKAALIEGCEVLTIPNPIDTEFYRPLESLLSHHGGGVVTVAPTREAVRQSLGLPTDRTLILFIAYKATEPNKGLSYLLEATKDMDVDLVVAGKCTEVISEEGRRGRIHAVGLVTDREKVRSLYQACDLMAMPTLKDNLPNTIVEGMACGLPCVGFRIGGLPEMIDHKENGYLADYCSSTSLREGIEYILHNDSRALSKAARLKAVQTYSEATVAARYAHLYERKLITS